MCLIIVSGPHVAAKDFYTLKIMDKSTETGGISPYKQFQYEFNKLYTSPLDPINNVIERGLHSLLVENLSNSGCVFEVVNYYYYFSDRGADFVLCKIPQGSTYYIGNGGDIASDTLLPLFKQTGVEREGFTKEHAKLVEEHFKASDYNIQPS